eukprot:m.244831 g.244831  ORF g.244831 m.244831 type:complete len:75 (-) comp26384_c1_seq2:1551-1775(-)
MLYIRGMIRGWGLICEMNQMAMLAPLTTHDSCVPGQASRKKKDEVTAESDWETVTSTCLRFQLLKHGTKHAGCY